MGANRFAVVELCWRLGPESTVEDQQADGDHAPDQAVEPSHPDGVGTGLPQVLVSMAPSVACAIKVSSALPEAWLNNQAYQKVTATVARASIGLDLNWGMTKNGMCQMVTPMAMRTVAASGVRVVCSLGWAQPRKLASGSWALRGLTMFMAIAIGRLYQTLNSAILGTGAQGGVQADGGERDRQRHAERERVPDPVDPPADRRNPMARSPATPSVSDTTI